MAAKRAYAAILLPTGYVYEYLNDNGKVTAKNGNNYSLWSGTGFTAIPAISGPAGTTTTVTLGGLDNTDRVALNVASEATSGIQGSTGRPYFWTQGNAPTPASYHYSLPLPSTAPSPKPTPQRQDQGIGLSAFGDNAWYGWESASTFYNGGESPSFGSAVNNGALYGEEYFFHNSDYTTTPNDGPRSVNAEMVTAVNKAGAAAGIKTVQGSGGRSTNYTYLSHGPFDTGFFAGGGTFDFYPENLDVAGNAFGKSFIFGNTDMWFALRDGTQGGVKIPGINRFYAMNEKRQAVSDDLWANFKKYPLKDLLPGTIDGQTVNSVSGSKINNHGVILGTTINLGGTSRTALLLPVSLYRDDALRTDDDNLTVKLDDWPLLGSKPRSPKYLFGKNDNIFIKLTGPQGMAAGTMKAKVTSESDTTGITFDLAETEPGVYVNEAPAKPLPLGNATETKSDHVTIKVVDEELLKFKIVLNGIEGEGPDVMVDKAEFASGGIVIFYNFEDGDRGAVRPEALTNSAFFDGGDNSEAALTEFTKAAGTGFVDRGEADFLHISSHGGFDGNLSFDLQRDQEPYRLLLDPDDANGIVPTQNWNKDIEWAILASCSQLNSQGGGRAAWATALGGTPRHLHGILGAQDYVSGDLRVHIHSFWEQMREDDPAHPGQKKTVLSSYRNAMEYTNPPQPWAIMYHKGHLSDQLKKTTQDNAEGGLEYYQVHIFPRYSPSRQAVKLSNVHQKLDGGNALVTGDLPDAAFLPKAIPSQTRLRKLQIQDRKLPFAKEVKTRANGATTFSSGKDWRGTSSLSEDAAVRLATAEIAAGFAELAPRVRLKASVLEANLCYVRQKDDVYAPAWHLVIDPRCNPDELKRDLQHVWIDAFAGNYLGKRKY